MYYSLNKRTLSHVKHVHTHCFPYTLTVVVSSLMCIKSDNIVWERDTHASCSCWASCTWNAWRAGWCWWGSGHRCIGWSGTTTCPMAETEKIKKGWRAKGAILKDECVTAQSAVSNREEDSPQQQGGWPWRLVRTPGAPTEESKIKGKWEQ